MNRSTETKMLVSYGYRQGEKGVITEGTCEDCDSSCNGNRGWWRKVSEEENEWDCKCRECAISACRFYEDFDADAYVQTVKTMDLLLD